MNTLSTVARKVWKNLATGTYVDAAGATGGTSVTISGPSAGKTWLILAASIEHSSILVNPQMWVEIEIGEDYVSVIPPESKTSGVPVTLPRPVLAFGGIRGMASAGPTGGVLTLKIGYVEVDESVDPFPPYVYVP